MLSNRYWALAACATIGLIGGCPPDPCPECTGSCLAEAQSLTSQASALPNHLVELENGSGAGQGMPRSCASNQSTVLMNSGDVRTLTLNLPVAADYEMRLAYSNDGPGTEDQAQVVVNGNQTRTFQLQDTRGDCCSGEGWNRFAVAGPVAPVVHLNSGENTITVTITAADTFGVELDALLLFASGN